MSLLTIGSVSRVQGKNLEESEQLPWMALAGTYCQAKPVSFHNRWWGLDPGFLQEPPFIFLIMFYQKPLQVQKYLNLDDSYRAAMVLYFPGLHAITRADSKGSWFSFGVYQPEDQVKSGQQRAPRF